MRNSFRTVALTAAIGVALAGAGLYSPGTAHAQANEGAGVAASEKANAKSTYIIRFVEDGLINYHGDVPGYLPTAPNPSLGQKLDITSNHAKKYQAFLETQRNAYRDSMESVLKRELDINHSYAFSFHGIATQLTEAEAAQIAQLSGVASVEKEQVYELSTYRGPSFIGADKVWDGSAVPGGVGVDGKGIVVGILDTGAALNHPSFANDPACGFDASNPKITGYDCSSSSGGLCTGSNPSANSGNGHGVHVAGTAAGNVIDNTVSPAPAVPDGVELTGVAPCAEIISYKVCQATTCGGADIAAGIEHALADGVDVVNFSISGGSSPWTDNDRGFLDMVDNGTFVAAAAGNNSVSDPTVIGRVNHRGPWVMSVAASTHDMIVGPTLVVTDPEPVPPILADGMFLNPGSTTNGALTPNWQDKPVKLHSANIEGCTDSGGIPAGTFDGSIAVVRRGTCPFSEKITNAANAGADLVVIANNEPGGINMDTTGAANVPAYSIEGDAGDALISFVEDGGTLADVRRVEITARQPDVIADFSYRGPTPGNLANLTKPDIAAPGVDIYAATDPGSGNYEFMGGTSMASPHVAGTGILMKHAHPDWSVSEIKSALQSTASIPGFMEDGSTAWTIDVVGSGRVQVDKAVAAGLTFDETKANYLAANPNGGSLDVRELNLPSLRDRDCVGSCSWTRTVKNRLDSTGSWTVGSVVDGGEFTVTAVPSTFTLDAGEEQEITFTATMDVTTSEIAFGFVTLTEDNDASPAQHLTVAVEGVSLVSYSISGQVNGLTGSGLELQLNGSHDLPISQDGPFEFTDAVFGGDDYSVTVSVQPDDQWCTVTNGEGTVGSSDITDVEVNCADADFYEIGGSITNLTGDGLVLQLNGGNDLPVAAGASSFSFVPGLPEDEDYTVTIAVQPTGQLCAVNNGSGTVGQGDVTSVEIVCDNNLYNVGGTVSGLLGGSNLKLQINGGQELTIPANVQFVFSQTSLPYGDAYEVVVSSQPTTPQPQLCDVINGSGTMPAENVRDVQVVCELDETPELPDEIFADGFEGEDPEAPSCAPEQLFADPSFEDTVFYDNPHWDGYDSIYGTPYCDASCSGGAIPANTGDWFVWLGGTDGPLENSVAQTVVLPEGQERWLNYWAMNVIAVDPSAEVEIRIDGDVVHTVFPGDDFNWSPKSFQIPAEYLDGDSHTIGIYWESNAPTEEDVGAFMLDDVTLDCESQPLDTESPQSIIGKMTRRLPN